MNEQNFSLIGLLNTNPSVAADCDLTDGQLTILDSTVTAGSLPWGGSVKWVDVVRNEVLAASTGAYLVQEFNTAAVVPTANTAYQVTITPDPASGLNAQTFIYRTGAVAPAIGALVTALAAQITADSQGTYLAVNAPVPNLNDLRIQGVLGNLNEKVYGFTMTINLSVTQTTVTPLSQPQGTPAIINKEAGIPLANITAAAYNTYKVYWTEKVQLASGTFEVVEKVGVVYVDNTADVLFAGAWNNTFGGLGVAADYLGRP